MPAGVDSRRYYRTVFQTRDYTLRVWSDWFEIVDYVERGIDGFQDLVTMRKRAEP